MLALSVALASVAGSCSRSDQRVDSTSGAHAEPTSDSGAKPPVPSSEALDAGKHGVTCHDCIFYMPGPALYDLPEGEFAPEVSNWVAVPSPAGLLHVPVTAPGEQSNVARWAPNHRRLAIELHTARERSRLFIADYDTEPNPSFIHWQVPIELAANETISNLVWLDEQRLALLVRPSDDASFSVLIVEVPFGSGDATSAADVRQLRIDNVVDPILRSLPEGRGALVSVSTGEGNCEWMRASLRGATMPISLSGAPCSDPPERDPPRVSADGRFATFFGGSSPAIVDLQNGLAVPIALPSGEAELYLWSEHGSDFAYSWNSWVPQGDFGYSIGELYMGNAELGSLRRFFDETRGNDHRLRGFVDESRIVSQELSTNQEHTFLIPLDPNQVPVDLGALPPDLSAAHGRIVTTSATEIRQVGTDSGTSGSIVLSHELEPGERLTLLSAMSHDALLYQSILDTDAGSERRYYLAHFESEHAATRLDVPSGVFARGFDGSPERLLLHDMQGTHDGALYWANVQTPSTTLVTRGVGFYDP